MLAFGMALIFAFYEICQLYITTVLDYEQYAKAASSQQWKLLTYASDRGQIYDANGRTRRDWNDQTIRMESGEVSGDC